MTTPVLANAPLPGASASARPTAPEGVFAGLLTDAAGAAAPAAPPGSDATPGGTGLLIELQGGAVATAVLADEAALDTALDATLDLTQAQVLLSAAELGLAAPAVTGAAPDGVAASTPAVAATTAVPATAVASPAVTPPAVTTSPSGVQAPAAEATGTAAAGPAVAPPEDTTAAAADPTPTAGTTTATSPGPATTPAAALPTDAGADGEADGSPSAAELVALPEPAPGATAPAERPAERAAVEAPSTPDTTGALPVGAVTATPSGPTAVAGDVSTRSATPQVQPAVAELARGLRDAGGGRASLVVRLDPPELGPVLVRLTVLDGRVDVQLRTSEAVAAAGLSLGSAEVRSMLAEHGLDLSSFDVGHDDQAGAWAGPQPDQRRPSPDRATPGESAGADRTGSADSAGALTGTTTEHTADGAPAGTWL